MLTRTAIRMALVERTSAAWGRLRRHAARAFARVPIVIQVQGAGLVMAVVATLAVGTLQIPDEYETHAFAVPVSATAMQPWNAEVEAFAQRMQLVFGVDEGVSREFSDWILEAARRQHLPPELIASLVFTESSFRKDAVSHVGAIGPAQIRPYYWESFCGSKMLRDPAENVYCGAQILAYFKESCGDARCALLSYNLGPRGMRMERFANAGHRYVSRIDSHLERFETYALDDFALENAAL
jgi:soluble lytic murein transglycosylase-like protein